MAAIMMEDKTDIMQNLVSVFTRIKERKESDLWCDEVARAQRRLLPFFPLIQAAAMEFTRWETLFSDEETEIIRESDDIGPVRLDLHEESSAEWSIIEWLPHLNPAPNWYNAVPGIWSAPESHSIPTDFVIAQQIADSLQEQFPEIDISELQRIIARGKRVWEYYSERGYTESQRGIVLQMIDRIHEWQSDHMSHVPLEDRLLLNALLPGHNLATQVEPPRTGVISEAQFESDVTNVETTGNKVSTDDLDKLFAQIDELVEENDE